MLSRLKWPNSSLDAVMGLPLAKKRSAGLSVKVMVLERGLK
jgi:hypothetical protein